MTFTQHRPLDKNHFDQIVEGLDAVVWEWDARTRELVFVSSRVETMYGYPAARFTAEQGFTGRIVHPDDAARAKQAFERVAKGGGSERVEFRVRHANGSEVFVEDFMTSEVDESGTVTAVRGFTIDVSEHVRARMELEETEERFRLMADAALDAIIIHDAGKIVFANATAARMLGYDQDSLVGLTFADVIAPEDHPLAMRRLQKPSDDPVEIRARRRDGSIFPAELHGRTVSLRGAPVRLIVARDLTVAHRVRMTEAEIRDLTQALHESQAQLIHSQKLEAIGRVTGGVAHDFNNLLTVILSYSQMLLDDVGENDRRREDILEIQRAAQRATTLTRQLLAFSRKQPVQAHLLNVNEVVQDTEKMLRRLLPAPVELTLSLSPEPATVLADRGQLEQVLVNLAINAGDAMPEGGLLTITTDVMEVADAEYASRHMGVDVPIGCYVVLTVADTGHGMTEAAKSHIFEPFYTTKPKGKGTGLGLATVYGIVKQAKGYIWVYSKLGTGTTFKIYFPKAE